MAKASEFTGQLAVFSAILAGILWGTAGVYIRFLSEIPAIPMIGIRFLIASGIILTVLLFSGKLGELSVKREDLAVFAVFALLNGLSTLLFTEGVLRVPLGNALFIFYTAPFFAIILARIFSKEEITKGKALALALSLLGAFLLFSPGNGGSLYGNLLCLGAAVLYAVFTITSRSLRKYSALSRTFWPFILPGIIFLSYSAVSGTLDLGKLGASTMLLFSAFALTISATFFLFNWALKHLPAGRTSILLLSEPLSAALLGFLFFSETPSGLAPFGFAMIAGAIAVDALEGKGGK